MPLTEVARIRLPPHSSDGGFDHAAIHLAESRLYVAHTSNDAVEVVDLVTRRWVRSIPLVAGVAGVWISEEPALLFTSNRGENTASVFRLPDEKELYRLPTGSRPNGMAFDPTRRHLLVAGVGDREANQPPTATVIDLSTGMTLNQIPLPGKTRWTLYHPGTDAFYVNISDPPCIAQIDSSNLGVVRRFLDIPASGPHGLDQHPGGSLLYCACDNRQLVVVDLPSGNARVAGELAGAPDVIWINARLNRVYVAVGEPGVVEVFGIEPFTHLETVPTGEGGHTLTVDTATDEVHVFLPETHEDLVLRESRCS